MDPSQAINFDAIIFTQALPFVRKFRLRVQPERMRQMLGEYVRASQLPPHERPLHFRALEKVLATGLERYLGGAPSLDAAFGLRRQRGGQKSNIVFQRRFALALDVVALRQSGKTRDEAIEIVSDATGKKIEYVRDAYDDFKLFAPPRRNDSPTI